MDQTFDLSIYTTLQLQQDNIEKSKIMDCFFKFYTVSLVDQVWKRIFNILYPIFCVAFTYFMVVYECQFRSIITKKAI